MIKKLSAISKELLYLSKKYVYESELILSFRNQIKFDKIIRNEIKSSKLIKLSICYVFFAKFNFLDYQNEYVLNVYYFFYNETILKFLTWLFLICVCIIHSSSIIIYYCISESILIFLFLVKKYIIVTYIL